MDDFFFILDLKLFIYIYLFIIFFLNKVVKVVIPHIFYFLISFLGFRCRLITTRGFVLSWYDGLFFVILLSHLLMCERFKRQSIFDQTENRKSNYVISVILILIYSN